MNVKLKHFQTEAMYSEPMPSHITTVFYRERQKWIVSHAKEKLSFLEMYGYMFSIALACSYMHQLSGAN